MKNKSWSSIFNKSNIKWLNFKKSIKNRTKNDLIQPGLTCNLDHETEITYKKKIEINYEEKFEINSV